MADDELELSQMRGAVVIVRMSLPEGLDPSGIAPRLPLASLFSPASPAAAVILVAEESELELWEYVAEIERKGIQVKSLAIDREQNAVLLNDMEFKLTAAAIETIYS
jgi:hypothetical protein